MTACPEPVGDALRGADAASVLTRYLDQGGHRRSGLNSFIVVCNGNDDHPTLWRNVVTLEHVFGLHDREPDVVRAAFQRDRLDARGPLRRRVNCALRGQGNERFVDGALTSLACGAQRFVGVAGARVKPALQWAVSDGVRRMPINGRRSTRLGFPNAVDGIARYRRKVLHLVVAGTKDRKAARHYRAVYTLQRRIAAVACPNARSRG